MALPRRSSLGATPRRAPSQARGQRTVAAILEAAAQVVRQGGEAAFTTNHIAERAGVSIGTLYQYFPDKATILARLVTDWRDEAVRLIDQALAPGATSDGQPAKTPRSAPGKAARKSQAPIEAPLRLVVRAVLHGFGGVDLARRPLVRLAWRLDAEGQMAREMRLAADRLALRLQPWAAERGLLVGAEQVYIATRAVLGAIRFASLEDSPLLDSPAFEHGLTRMVLALLLPADNLPP